MRRGSALPPNRLADMKTAVAPGVAGRAASPSAKNRGSTQDPSASTTRTATPPAHQRLVPRARTSGTTEAAATYGVNARSATPVYPRSQPASRTTVHAANGTTHTHTTTVVTTDSHLRRGSRAGGRDVASTPAVAATSVPGPLTAMAATLRGAATRRGLHHRSSTRSPRRVVPVRHRDPAVARGKDTMGA